MTVHVREILGDSAIMLSLISGFPLDTYIMVVTFRLMVLKTNKKNIVIGFDDRNLIDP